MNASPLPLLAFIAACMGTLIAGCTEPAAESLRDEPATHTAAAQATSRQQPTAPAPATSILEVTSALPPKVSEVPAEVREQVLALVKEYRAWDRVSDRVKVAPELCRAVTPQDLAPRMSMSDDAETHGDKLYYLYARDDRYRRLGLGSIPDNPELYYFCSLAGQMIIKESYDAVQKGGNYTPGNLRDLQPFPGRFNLPQFDEDESVPSLLRPPADTPDQSYAVKDGKCYIAGERRDLFVMFKAVDNEHSRHRTDMKIEYAEPPDWSDDGWVYATLPADGSRLDQIGRISSCMQCHVTAPHDRCFGLHGLTMLTPEDSASTPSSSVTEPAAAEHAEPAELAEPAAENDAEVPAEVREDVLKLVGDYRTWKRVSDYPNWALALCAATPRQGIQASRSADTDTHGDKLYYLYARNPDYISLGTGWHRDNPELDERCSLAGQMIVKESYDAVQQGGGLRSPLSDDNPELLERFGIESINDLQRVIDSGESYVIKDGKCYIAGERRDLFVMFKAVDNQHSRHRTDIKIEYTEPPAWSDNGWIYATLPADGSRIDHIGRISSCMQCHVTAPYDRCFGMRDYFWPIDPANTLEVTPEPTK